MTPERWRQIEQVIQQALDLQPDERDAFLQNTCTGNDDLRLEVNSFLAMQRSAHHFLEKPAIFQAAHEFGTHDTASWIGRRVGPYEVLSVLGIGGMGEVYRACDMRLKRDVAIKVLPVPFTTDPERLSRFRREAEVLASLNHPHIAAIYDVADFAENPFLVLEFVEGPTLAERIDDEPISISEALQIAKQIAEALQAAHEKGVIHRDLKPANIKLGSNNNVKILDFGLAKVCDIGCDNATSSNSRTMATEESRLIVGTPRYMPPEQSKGEQVDRTADIWAFGCILYELLTGQAVFEGEGVGDVSTEAPDWSRLPVEVPENIRRLLRRCIRRERKLRLHDMADVIIEMEDLHQTTEPAKPVLQDSSQLRARLIWVSTIALVVAAILGIRFAGRQVAPSAEMWLEIDTPPTDDPVSLAISRDGQQVVFVATAEGASRLWLRSLHSTSAHPLKGTESARYPFWAPEGHSIGFFAEGKLKRIDIPTESVEILAYAPQGRGGAWNDKGTILFAPNNNGPLFQIPSNGGEPVPVTRIHGPTQRGHRYPQFLPDGDHFVYYVNGEPDALGIYLSNLSGSDTKQLLHTDAAGAYAAQGQLLYVRQRTLFAQAFNSQSLALSGNAVRIAEEVLVDPTESSALSTSMAGPIVYRTGPSMQRQLVWFDRAGRELERLSTSNAPQSNPSLSPDGLRVALQRRIDGKSNVWLLDTRRAALIQFTAVTEPVMSPIWSPDSKSIAFTRFEAPAFNLYRMSTAAGSSPELLLKTPQAKFPTDWSRNGNFLLYEIQDPGRGSDIWALALKVAAPTPFPVVRKPFTQRGAQFSPDGNWIAYESDESGRFQIYVQPFPGPGDVWPVTVNGGKQVRWRADGKELFYVAMNGEITAVPIAFAGQGRLSLGSPVALFTPHSGGSIEAESSYANIADRQQYIVSADGQRFLVNTVTNFSASPLTIILNRKTSP